MNDSLKTGAATVHIPVVNVLFGITVYRTHREKYSEGLRKEHNSMGHVMVSLRMHKPVGYDF